MAKTKEEKEKAREAKRLARELNELFLKDGAGLELAEKGFYPRAKQAIFSFGGSVDKNTEQLERLKVVIESLVKAV